MANQDNPIGLRAFMQSNKAPKVTRYYHASGDSVAIFIGDPVVKTGTGHTDKDCTPIVAAGGADGVNTGSSASYCAADTGGYILVNDDPLQEFVIQCDTGQASAVTDIGSNCNFIAGAGSTATGKSAYELDLSSATTTVTLSAKIRGIDKRVDNIIGAHCDMIVTLNTATEADNTAGI